MYKSKNVCYLNVFLKEYMIIIIFFSFQSNTFQVNNSSCRDKDLLYNKLIVISSFAACEHCCDDY